MDDLEKIKQKVDIVELIGGFLQLKKAGRNFKTNCPFHNEKTASFVISPERQIWHCFGCQKGGDIFTFLMEYENIDFSESLKILAEKSGIKLQGPAFKNESEKKKETIYSLNNLTANLYNYLLLNHKTGEKALNYLINERKISKEIIKRFNLGYAPRNGNFLSNYLINKKGAKKEDLLNSGLSYQRGYLLSDFFLDRIIFPIYDARSNIIGFSGRTLGSNLPKYINIKETLVYKKGETLFGLNLAKDDIKKEKEAIIVEGEFDVISPFKEGVKNIVAIKGTALTLPQIKILKRYAEKIIFCFDSDVAGEEAQRRSIEMIEKEGITANVIVLPKGKDLDELIKEDLGLFKKTVKKSVSMYDFLIDSVLSMFDKNTSDGKKKILEKTLPVLSLIENEVVKEHYFKKLAELIDSSLESVTKQAEKIKQPKKIYEKNITYKALSREEIIEPYLFSLILQSKNPKEHFLLSYEILQDVSFVKLSYNKLYKHLSDFILSKNEFTINDFVKALPQEMLDVFDKCYLAPLPNLDDEKKYSDEINKIASEIKRIFLSNTLKDIGQKITEQEKAGSDEEVEKLKNDFNKYTSLLSREK